MGHLTFGSQEHMRRGSSQSMHSEAGNASLPTGPSTRGGYMQGGGRGRGNNYGGPYQQHQMPYSPQTSFRGAPNGRGMPPNYHPRGGAMQYQSSPGVGTRSPAMMHAAPGTPQMNQMHMVPGMQGQPNGYYMPHQVKPHAPHTQETARGKRGKTRSGPSRGRGRGGGRGSSEDGPPQVSRDPASNYYQPGLPVGVNLFPFPDLSPESGNFEHFLTQRAQGMNVPTAADPSIQMYYNQQMQYQQGIPGQYPNYMPPQSPRPPFQQGGYAPQMPHTYSSQGQPQSMSRQSSQMSVPDRPGSSVGQQPHTPAISTPSIAPHSNARTPSVSAPKSNFTVPAKKSAAIQIKNAAGEVVSFNKPPASPATATPAPATPLTAPSAAPVVAAAPAAVPTPSASTPPSQSENAAETSHARSESISAKTAEEKKKAMQEEVAKRIAEQAKLKQIESHVEEKAEIDEEEREAAVLEAQQAKERAEALEKEASEARARKEPTSTRKESTAQSQIEEPVEAEAENSEPEQSEPEQSEPEQSEPEQSEPEQSEPEQSELEKSEPEKSEPEKSEPEKPEPEKPEPEAAGKPQATDDDEIDFDAIEAEMAAAEAEEARREEEYAKKKAAAKETQRKKEEEEVAAYEANMKEAERKAEELEVAREKERDAGSGDEASKKMFAELKSDSGFATPGSTDTPAIATPGESGTATPVSEASSMPPPAKVSSAKRGKATELTLDTKKPVEPPEPSATLKALHSARKLEDLSSVNYPSDIASPNPALNQNAPPNRGFKYDKTFLLQFQSIFKEKPSLDWDVKIRDALGDGESSARPSASARTPSSMGGRSMSNRPAPPANAFGPMGAFGGQRSLPPGTTSEQRFAQSNAALRGAPVAAQNPFAQFGRGAMGAPMARNPSSNALGPIPGSPRVGGSSRGGSRVESKRGKQSNKAMAQENNSMPLTAGMSLGPLEVSSTGWKPRSVGQPTLGPTPGGGGGEALMDPETVQRKVKAALNKMTPEKFERLADQILEIAAQSKHETDGRTLRQVIQLTFEKATDEAHWAPMYAMFCAKMLESMSPDIKDENVKDKSGAIVVGGNLFRKYLLNRCQEEFERGWKVNLPDRPEGQTEEAVLLSDEYYVAAAAKRTWSWSCQVHWRAFQAWNADGAHYARVREEARGL